MASKTEESIITSHLEINQLYTEPAKKLPATWRQFLWIEALVLFTAVWIVVTIVFAYNSVENNPLIPAWFHLPPNRTLLILNILSHGAVLLLQILTSITFETVRWAAASSVNGISPLAFLVLSKSTDTRGVLSLVFHRGLGHMGWGLQRFAMTESC